MANMSGVYKKRSLSSKCLSAFSLVCKRRFVCQQMRAFYALECKMFTVLQVFVIARSLYTLETNTKTYIYTWSKIGDKAAIAAGRFLSDFFLNQVLALDA